MSAAATAAGWGDLGSASVSAEHCVAAGKLEDPHATNGCCSPTLRANRLVIVAPGAPRVPQDDGGVVIEAEEEARRRRHRQGGHRPRRRPREARVLAQDQVRRRRASWRRAAARSGEASRRRPQRRQREEECSNPRPIYGTRDALGHRRRPLGASTELVHARKGIILALARRRSMRNGVSQLPLSRMRSMKSSPSAVRLEEEHGACRAPV